MKRVVLFRKDLESEGESQIVSNYFETTSSRVNLRDSLVIGRYSVLPYYKELEADLASQGSRLINSFEQHCYIANFDYYKDIPDLTPKTYFNLRDIVESEAPFVVKGCTNSRKFDWETKMFAENRSSAINIALDLQKDGLLQNQKIVTRKFEKLKVLEIGLNGLPFANEWRFFCYQDRILSYGFYWSISSKMGQISEEAITLVQEVCNRVKHKVNFFVVDVAEKEDGSWIVIELNDGQMSGLSSNDPNTLYSELNKALI